MVIADTSVLIPWLEGRDTDLAERLEDLLRQRGLATTWVTVTEIFSGLEVELAAMTFAMAQIAKLPTKRGYWRRAGLLRAAVLRESRKAALADALIAQACIDHDTPLLTSDRDFRAFAEIGGLRLA